MSQALLVILGVYLLACYGYGLLLLVRLWSAKSIVRPTAKLDTTELAKAALEELEQGDQRVAA